MIIVDYDNKLWHYDEDRQRLFRLTYGLYGGEFRKALFTSQEEAVEFLKNKREFLGEIGRIIWAYLDAPNGDKKWL